MPVSKKEGGDPDSRVVVGNIRIGRGNFAVGVGKIWNRSTPSGPGDEAVTGGNKYGMSFDLRSVLLYHMNSPERTNPVIDTVPLTVVKPAVEIKLLPAPPAKPQILMPPQPKGYIKARQHHFF